MKLIGVYGSLKSGFYNHYLLGEDAVFKGMWHVRGEMTLIQELYPMLKLDEDRGHHAVEIYEVSDDVFDDINLMETYAGYYPKKIEVGGIEEWGVQTLATIWVVTKLYGKPIISYDELTAPNAYVESD